MATRRLDSLIEGDNKKEASSATVPESPAEALRQWGNANKKQGPPGKQGPQGPRGIGISSVELVDENLYVIYDNGERELAGKVRDGEDGETPEKGVDYFTQEEVENIIQKASKKAERRINIEMPDTIAGPPGPQGPPGDIPDHEWDGTKIRFQNPDGSWGTWTDLQGDEGKEGKKKVLHRGGSSRLVDLNDIDTSNLTKNSDGNYVLGSGGGEWVNEEPTGAVDGANTTYEISNEPVDGTINVYVNGQYQREGEEYTLNGTTINMDYAPQQGNLYAKYQKS